MLNPMDLSGRTILVTGASAGIGRETCVLLSQLGARAVLVARNTERLQETASRLEGEGHRIESFDLTAVEDIPRWLKGVTAEIGALDGLVHCAGIAATVPVRYMNRQHLEDTLLTNLSAAIFLTKAFRQKGCYRPGSCIVLISSAAAFVGVAGLAAYTSSKGALVALTKSLAVELARDKIRVNCVAPGFVKTDMLEDYKLIVLPDKVAAVEAAHLLGMGTPRDVAYSIAFLLAETGRWITGTTLVVDGGFTAT
jgi:NAD(P)-dependent dehydrogenase (short-subunit alcohol dehydrogenase family)